MRGKLKIPTARQSSYCAILTDQNVNGLQGASCMVARPNRCFFFESSPTVVGGTEFSRVKNML